MTIFGIRSFTGFEPHNLECFVGEEADIKDGNIKSAQLKYHLMDQGKELVEINLVDEGREGQPVFLSASL